MSKDINAPLSAVDPEIYAIIQKEYKRQNDKIMMIASENYASCAQLEAQGSVLTNKYAEGYSGKRYYGGCEFIDEAETLAIQRACELFGADHANVQPHCGSAANMAAYYAVMKPGDTFMAMSLDQGGHLTHGHKVNFSGTLYNAVPYGVDRETEVINMDEVERISMECKPRLILTGATVYPRLWDWERFRAIADKVGALLMCDMAHIAGLIAAGVHPSPIPYCDIVTATTHKTLRGPRGGMILCKEYLAKDIDRAVFPGLQGGPLEHVIAAKAVCFREAMSAEYKEYQKQVIANARALAASLEEGGVRLVSGGTDNHLMLCDVTPLGITGKQAQEILNDINIVVNKNQIPFDKEKPFVSSGVRIGTPCVTTRGMKEKEMKVLGEVISCALKQYTVGDLMNMCREKVDALASDFPVYTK
ncbi:MAG: serine hydroxymethyltransferase [Abditibacteriota bacterium]|nr:serine hydroxymethyltransferase [Abditibacteriota bacterium]